MFPTANTQVFRNSNDSLRYINQFLLPFYLTYRIQLFFLKWRWVIKYSRIMLEVKPDFKLFSVPEVVVGRWRHSDGERRKPWAAKFDEKTFPRMGARIEVKQSPTYMHDTLHLTLDTWVDKQIWCWTGKIGFKKLANEVPRPSKGTKKYDLKT
jgi:hypothetical protein